MWYTVESDKTTIKNEGQLGCELTYRNLREDFRLPPPDAVAFGLSGDFSRLIEWNQLNHVEVLPFTFEKERRIKIDLVPTGGNVAVGTVWYGASKTISASFSRTSDARDMLGRFYPHWLISYAALGSEYARMSIREVLERTDTY
jgi:hypothetical protein